MNIPLDLVADLRLSHVAVRVAFAMSVLVRDVDGEPVVLATTAEVARVAGVTEGSASKQLQVRKGSPKSLASVGWVRRHGSLRGWVLVGWGTGEAPYPGRNVSEGSRRSPVPERPPTRAGGEPRTSKEAPLATEPLGDQGGVRTDLIVVPDDDHHQMPDQDWRLTSAGVEQALIELDQARMRIVSKHQGPQKALLQAARISLGRDRERHARNLGEAIREMTLPRVQEVMEYRWEQVALGALEPRHAAYSFHGDGSGFRGSVGAQASQQAAEVMRERGRPKGFRLPPREQTFTKAEVDEANEKAIAHMNENWR